MWLRRGAIITTFIVCYALTSFISGYVSGGMYSRHGGRKFLPLVASFAYFCYSVAFIFGFCFSFLMLFLDVSFLCIINFCITSMSFCQGKIG